MIIGKESLMILIARIWFRICDGIVVGVAVCWVTVSTVAVLIVFQIFGRIRILNSLVVKSDCQANTRVSSGAEKLL